MTRRPSSQCSRNLLKRTTRQCSLRPLHPGLQGADLEFSRPDIGSDVQFASCGESGVGGLDGQRAGVECFGAFAGGICVLILGDGFGVGFRF